MFVMPGLGAGSGILGALLAAVSPFRPVQPAPGLQPGWMIAVVNMWVISLRVSGIPVGRQDWRVGTMKARSWTLFLRTIGAIVVPLIPLIGRSWVGHGAITTDCLGPNEAHDNDGSVEIASS
jgi:hypothetical protein